MAKPASDRFQAAGTSRARDGQCVGYRPGDGRAAGSQRRPRGHERLADRGVDNCGESISKLRGCGWKRCPAISVCRRARAMWHSKTLELLGGLDYLVNNAGAPGTRTPIPPSDLDALTDDFWDRILRINLLSAFWMTKALAPALTDAQGRRGQYGIGGGARRRRQQHRLRDRQGGTCGIDAGTGSRSRAGRPGQRDCAGLREFQLGMLVRRHGRCGKGDGALGARGANRRLCGSDRVSVCRRIVYHGRGHSGHGRHADLTAGIEGDRMTMTRALTAMLPARHRPCWRRGGVRRPLPSSGCGKTLASGSYQMTDQNVTRTYRVFVPSGYKPGIAYPLVMVFHGWGGDENEFLGDSNVTTLADQRGYIVVAPRGLGSGAPDVKSELLVFPRIDDGARRSNRRWAPRTRREPRPPLSAIRRAPRISPIRRARTSHATPARGRSAKPMMSPSRVALVKEVESKLCVDTARVFASGGSNGGMFTWELGQNTASAPIFRAIASLIGLPHRGYLDAPSESGRYAGLGDHGDARYDRAAGCVGEHSLHNDHRWERVLLHRCVRDCPQLGNRE